MKTFFYTLLCIALVVSIKACNTTTPHTTNNADTVATKASDTIAEIQPQDPPLNDKTPMPNAWLDDILVPQWSQRIEEEASPYVLDSLVFLDGYTNTVFDVHGNKYNITDRADRAALRLLTTDSLYVYYWYQMVVNIFSGENIPFKSKRTYGIEVLEDSLLVVPSITAKYIEFNYPDGYYTGSIVCYDVKNKDTVWEKNIWFSGVEKNDIFYRRSYANFDSLVIRNKLDGEISEAKRIIKRDSLITVYNIIRGDTLYSQTWRPLSISAFVFPRRMLWETDIHDNPELLIGDYLMFHEQLAYYETEDESEYTYMGLLSIKTGKVYSITWKDDELQKFNHSYSSWSEVSDGMVFATFPGYLYGFKIQSPPLHKGQ